MEPLFKQAVIGLVPQPMFPQAQFEPEDLQRAYMDVSRERTYAQFQLLPGGGAQFLNGLEDAVTVQPSLIQVRYPVGSTTQIAREQCTNILRALQKRFDFKFLATGIKVIAHVPTSGSARQFVADKLMQGEDHAQILGGGYAAGGVKYVSLPTLEGQPGETLLMEPLLQDDSFLFIDYDVQYQQALTSVDIVATWIDAAFGFVQGAVMDLLNSEGKL